MAPTTQVTGARRAITIQVMEFVKPNVAKDNLQEMRTIYVFKTVAITMPQPYGGILLQKLAKLVLLAVQMVIMRIIIPTCVFFL